jgi:hypothetical protein
MRHESRATDDIEDKLRRICEDDAARHELLWLRAQEKDDPESIALLERADPALRPRMAALLAEAGLDRIEDLHERRLALGRLWDVRFEALGHGDP